MAAGLANTIGLTAVMEMAGFTQGINKYNEMVNGAATKTEKGASIITKAFANIGKVAVGLAVGGITAITTAMAAGLKASTKWAEKLDSIGDVLGTTTEESAALAVAAQHIGGNVEQLTSQMAILTRGLFDAKGEIGPTGTVLQQMGIAFQDANGNILPTTQILQSVADKLAVMPDGLAKTQLMMDLFGKSGKDMSDMMGVLANGGMEAMNQKAKDLGLSMSEEASQGAIELGRSMNDLKMAGQGLLVTLGTELLPILKPIIDGFINWAMIAIPKVRQAIDDAMPVIKEIFGWINENIIPIIRNVANWLEINIPIAIQKAKTEFNEHLLPPLTALKNFIEEHVLPKFSAVYEYLKMKIPEAINEVKKWINEHLTPAWKDLKEFVETKFLPAIQGTTTELGKKLPEATGVSESKFKEFLKDPLKPTIEDFKWLVKVLEAADGWIGRHLPASIQSSKPGWAGFEESLGKIWTIIKEKLVGPDGALTKLKDWYDQAHIDIDLLLTGPLAGWVTAFNDIKTAVTNLKDEIIILIEKLSFLGNIKLPNIFGSKGRIELGLEGITRGFEAATEAETMFAEALGGLTAANVGGLTSFASAILGRFQEKYTTPLNEKVIGLREELATITESMQNENLAYEELMNLEQRRREIEAELAATSAELNIQKERELELQKQLNDLAFLQAQMDFLSFLKENKLDMAAILGDLQLGLNLDLPAFMDAISRALASLVNNLNSQLSGSGSDIGSSPAGFAKGITGNTAGGGSAIYNNRTVIINMNGAINNGMDMAVLKSEVLSWVTEAIGA